MPSTSDLRAYADSAVHAGKEFAGSVLDGARGNVTGLRTSAEKLVNVDAVRTELGHHVAQLRDYGDSMTDRIEELIVMLKDDPRLGKVLETVDSVSNVVIDAIRDHLPSRPA